MKQYRVFIQPKLQKQIDCGNENGQGQSDSMFRLFSVFPQLACPIYINIVTSSSSRMMLCTILLIITYTIDISEFNDWANNYGHGN